MACRFGGSKTLPACLSGVAALYMKDAMDPSKNSSTLVDALVKLTRLIANMCISKEAGVAIASGEGVRVQGAKRRAEAARKRDIGVCRKDFCT